MFAEFMLSLLLICVICAVGMAIVALEYMENIQAGDAYLMKYGICLQIWSFLILCVLRFEYPSVEMLLSLMPMFSLLGAGIFMLGALSVFKVLQRAKSAFACLALGIQLCVIAFLNITTCLIP